MSVLGGVGMGREDSSSKTWTKESAKSDESVCTEKSDRHWVDVDENKDIMGGCTALENISLDE